MIETLIVKYINHKIALAKNSNWYKSQKTKLAVEKLQYLLNYIRRNKEALSKKNIAYLVVSNKQDFFEALRCPKNNSYETSLNNYNKILQISKEILENKTAQVPV